MADQTIVKTDHALVPTRVDLLMEGLREEHSALAMRRDELLEAAKLAPSEVTDDETTGLVGDFIKQMTATMKNAEIARVAAKEPHLEAGRAVDGFFKMVIEPLKAAKVELEQRVNVYLRRKAEEERRRREEEAERVRQEALRREEEAAEASKELRTNEDFNRAIAAVEEADQAAGEAAKARKAADASAADLSRTRGARGSVSSLQTKWDFEIRDPGSVDLEALRPFIPPKTIEPAIRAFIDGGGRKLGGVRIFPTTHTVVR